MSPEERPNPLGHIRFPTSFPSPALTRQIEETVNLGSRIAEQYASYRPPQIDYAAFADFTKRFDTMLQSSLAYTNRFSAMLDASMRSWEQAQKTITSVMTSHSFLDAVNHTTQIAERLTDAVMRLPTILPDLSVLQDQIIMRDFVFPDTVLPPAGEYRVDGLVLPLEEIIQENITLDPVEIEEIAEQASSMTAEETAVPGETVSAPLFLQTLDLDLQEKIYEMLPPEADLIDDTIALFEPRKAGIFILTQYGWVKEEEGVSTQTIRVIQYLRRIGKRPGNPAASLTELASVLAKRSVSIRTARSSISNRIARLEEICMERNLKPILLRSAGLWRINTALTRWDAISVRPWVHT